VLRGPALIPLALLRGAATALRAMDGARRIALLVTAGLVASLFAPWFLHTTVAHGLTGPRRLQESFTGWDALPAAAYVCVAVAALVWCTLFARSATPVSGLGADGRRAARARVDGVLVMGLGLAAVAWLAGALVDHPGSSAPAVGATTAVGVRWGVALALVLALMLTGLGVLIVRAAAAAVAVAAGERATAPRRLRLASRRPTTRPRRSVRAAREGVRLSSLDGSAPATDPSMPDFDFAVSDEPVPSAPGSAARRAAGQPRRRKSGPGSGTFSRSAR
jgi:hypothetical protein